MSFSISKILAIENVEILKSNRNSPLLCYNGYTYQPVSKFSDVNMIWRCQIQGCHGRIRVRNGTVEIRQEHQHGPDPVSKFVRKAKSEIRELANTTIVLSPQEITNQVMS